MSVTGGAASSQQEGNILQCVATRSGRLAQRPTFKLFAIIVLTFGLHIGALHPTAAYARDKESGISTPDPIRPASWVKDSDYPSKAMRERRVGHNKFKLSITAAGRVSDCIILESSGHADLDERTCEIMTRRGRFKPATNAQGEPVSGMWDSAFTWSLP